MLPSTLNRLESSTIVLPPPEIFGPLMGPQSRIQLQKRPRLSYPRLPDRASLDVTRTIANHGSLCNGMFFGVRNCPVFIRALGRNSGFCFKIDPNCIFPPARRYSQEALWSAKHSPTVTRTVANHGSLSNRKVFRVRNHPGIMRAPRSPPLARGMNSDFCSKIDQYRYCKTSARRYTEEALCCAPHYQNITRTIAKHWSLSDGMLLGVRNRPGVVGAGRDPP